MSEGLDKWRDELLDALARTGGNRSRAAEILGIGRGTLYRRLVRLGLEKASLRVVAHRYELLEAVWVGPHHSVYDARDRARAMAPRRVSVVAGDAPYFAQWEEARAALLALVQLRHAGLVPVLDAGHEDATDEFYLVSERVTGANLAELARQLGPVDLLRTLAEPLAALAAMHRLGLAYEGLTPHVIVAPDGRGLLLLPPPLGGIADVPLAHLAPEVVAGGRSTPRSDMYTLGRMLIELFAGFTLEPQQRPSALNPAVPHALDDVLLRLVEPEPAARPSDAAALLDLLRPWVDPVVPRVGPGRAARPVGRDEEIRSLLAVLRPRPVPSFEPLVFVTGESGIGKSLVVETVLDALRSEAVPVADVPCRQGGVKEFVEAIVAALDVNAAGEPAPLSPAEQALCAALAPGAFDAIASGRRPAPREILDQLPGLLRRAAERRPFVIALENLDRADAFLLELLGLLARERGGAALRIVARFATPLADSTLAAWVRAMTAENLARTVTIGPLDEVAVRTLTAEVLGPARATVLSDRMFGLSGGHPLLLLELLRDAVERGSGPVDDNPSMAAVVRARLERLPAHAFEVFRAVSVMDGPVTREDVAEFVSFDPGPALRLLEQRRLVNARGGRFEPAHALLREQAAASMDAEGLRAWHARRAEQLAGQPGRVVERARHMLRSGAADDGAVFVAAGRELFARLELSAAARMFEAAIASCPAGSAVALPIYELLERALHLMRERERAIPACRSWRELARAAGDRRAEVRATTMLVAKLRESGDTKAARETAAEGLQLARELGDTRALARAEKLFGSVLWSTWEHDLGLAHLLGAVARCREDGDPRTLGHALADSALPLAVAGWTQRAHAAIDEAKALFEAVDEPVWKHAIHVNEGLVLAFEGDLEGAVACQRRAIAGLQPLRAEVPVEHPLENLALLLLRLGRHEQALEAAAELVAEAIRFGRPMQRVAGLLVRGEAHFLLDERDAAREHHRLALELALALGVPAQEQFARLALARDARCDLRYDEAARTADGVFAWAEREQSWRVAALAAIERGHVALAAGSSEDALSWCDRAERALRIPREDGPAHRAMLLALRAEAHLAAGATGLAQGAALSALALACSFGPGAADAAATRVLAECFERRGDRSAAARALQQWLHRLESRAGSISDPLRRARFLARPDLEALRVRARAANQFGAEWPDFAAGQPRAIDVLFGLGRSLSRGIPPETVIADALSSTVDGGCCERAVLLLRGARGTWVQSAGVRAEPDLVAAAFTAAQALGSSAGTDTPALPPAVEAGLRTMVCAPLCAHGAVLGLIVADARRGRDLDSAASRRFLQALADHAALGFALQTPRARDTSTPRASKPPRRTPPPDPAH